MAGEHIFSAMLYFVQVHFSVGRYIFTPLSHCLISRLFHDLQIPVEFSSLGIEGRGSSQVVVLVL